VPVLSTAASRDFIRTEVDAQVGWLVLNRPQKLNAMNPQLLAEFTSAVQELTDHPQVRVIVIRGEGRCFSTGYDIERDSREIGEDADAVTDYSRLTENVDRFLGLWECPKPVIAAVHGYCLAGATQMCVFTDLTIVAENAQVGLPKIPVGGGYITPIWTWLVGPKRAKQMSFMSGSSISGETAAQWGWANYAVPGDQLWDEVRRVAADIARTPGPILQMKKYAVNRVVDMQGFRSSVQLGSETDALLHASNAVHALSQLIKDNGLKKAIEIFEAGESA
jgi:enoyl-CoA hydratase